MPANRINRPVILGIVGDSAAGKTTLTKGIKRILGEERVATFCTDDYHMYDREERKKNKTEALDPSCNYLDILESHLRQLRKGRSILKPVYNHDNGILERPVYLKPMPYIISEGLLGYHSRGMRDSYDVKIYLAPTETLRREWKIKRDTEKRGYTPEEVEKQLESRKPISEAYIDPQNTYGDLVLNFLKNEEMPDRLDVRITMRPTLPHPDLSPILSDCDSDIKLELARDANNKPVDVLTISGCISDANGERVEKLIWELMPEAIHLRERAKQFMGKDFLNHPLLIAQLIVCFHMIKAAQGISAV